MTRFELVTSSLPRKRSTPELHRLLLSKLSGRRDSNSRPSAWKADALPTELLPLKKINSLWGEQDSNLRRWKPTDLQSVLVGRLSISPTFWADGGIRTPDQLITNQLLWPTELHRHCCNKLKYFKELQNQKLIFWDCKCMKEIKTNFKKYKKN